MVSGQLTRRDKLLMTEVVKILNTWQVTISLALFSQKNLIKNIDLAYIFVFLITCMITFNVKFKLLLSKKRIFFCILLDIKYLINICVTPLQSKNNRIYNKMLQHSLDFKKKAANNNQFRFWNHEYNRHGSCTDIIPKEYFRKTLDMKIKVDMLAVLCNNKIKAGGFYSRSTIEEAFQKKFGTTSFGVKCFWKESKRRLIEIKICTNTTHVIPCEWFEIHEWRTCGEEEI